MPIARNRSPFYFYLAIAFLIVALAGFSTTFFFPLARGTFSAPLVIYIHGALLFGWLLLLILQTALVKDGRSPVHRRVGWAGFGIAIAIVVSGLLVGLFATRRDLASTGETWPFGSLVNIAIEMLVFGALVSAANIYRKQPEIHKRLLILATISALGPAWFRFRHFMPFVPNPLVGFSLIADAVLLVVIIRDWFVLKRVHPTYLWAGGTMFCVHVVELTAAETELWTRLGRGLMNLAP